MRHNKVCFLFVFRGLRDWKRNRDDRYDMAGITLQVPFAALTLYLSGWSSGVKTIANFHLVKL